MRPAPSEQFDPGAHPGAVVARLSAPTAPTETSLAVVADPHVATRAEGSPKLFDRSEAHLENAVADINERGVDAVLFAGDLTKDGEPYNHAAGDDLLDWIEAPVYGVPGNHDVPKSFDDHDAPSVGDFARRYAPGGAYPFRTQVGGVTVVGLNTAGDADRLADTHHGGLDPERLSAVRDALAAADEPVVLAHHNLPALSEQYRAHRDAVDADAPIAPEVANGDTFVEALADGGTALLLTGHLHIPATAAQAGVREISAPATGSFPQAYLTVTVAPGGTTVRYHPVAGREGMRRAFEARHGGHAVSRTLAQMAATRLARFPLVDG